LLPTGAALSTGLGMAFDVAAGNAALDPLDEFVVPRCRGT
jgi:hypothetical protein